MEDEEDQRSSSPRNPIQTRPPFRSTLRLPLGPGGFVGTPECAWKCESNEGLCRAYCILSRSRRNYVLGVGGELSSQQSLKTF